MKQSNATVKHESTASLALKNGKLLILEVGDELNPGACVIANGSFAAANTACRT